MVARGKEGGRDAQVGLGIFQGSETLLCDTARMSCWHCAFVKHVECTTPKMSPDVKPWAWEDKMCQCRLVICNKCTIWCRMLIFEEVMTM